METNEEKEKSFNEFITCYKNGLAHTYTLTISTNYQVIALEIVIKLLHMTWFYMYA